MVESACCSSREVCFSIMSKGGVLGWSVGCRMATRSFYDSESAIFCSFCRCPFEDCTTWGEAPWSELWWKRTFNMCSRVVFPALSSPRNRSFACLFNKPRDASTSQTRFKQRVVNRSPKQSRCSSWEGWRAYTNLSST